MKLKKMVAAVMVGAMLMGAAPLITDNMVSTAYAAKGGAKMGGGGAKAVTGSSAPKSAPSASENSGKAVSGNGGSYQPSKDAKSLDKNAPAANANAKTNTAAANTQSGSRWGSALRNIGLFAGGMMLGSMLAGLFGMGGGMLGDIMGVLANVAMLFVAIMVIKWLWNKFRGNNNKNVYQTAKRPEPINVTPPQSTAKAPIMDIKAPASGTDYDAKTMADRYRNK